MLNAEHYVIGTREKRQLSRARVLIAAGMKADTRLARLPLRLWLPQLEPCWLRILSTRGSTALPIQGRTHILPPGTTVIGVFVAVHANPAIWGADALDFKPERFMINDTDPKNT
ncbi:MAG: cytochrome P450, partial [Terriglobus roseus]|nr:cytochrome P450 [Terriglobus roseus]